MYLLQWLYTCYIGYLMVMYLLYTSYFTNVVGTMVMYLLHWLCTRYNVMYVRTLTTDLGMHMIIVFIMVCSVG